MDPATTFDIATAPKRNSWHWKAGTVTWGEICAWPDHVADRKESGGYLLGVLRETTAVHKSGEDPCTALHRRKDAVVSRSALTLDVDSPDPSFLEKITLALPYAACVHSTYSSSPDDRHYRLIVPLDRPVAPDEYVVACQAVMQLLGSLQFDPSTTQPERFMFLPAAQEPGWFESVVVDGPAAVADELLADFDPDLSSLPMPKPSRNKRNPFEIGGVIGSFNRAYEDWDLLIEVYGLPYEKIADDRYQLAGVRSQAGMGPIAGAQGFVYSHHVNDPAYGQTCSAFDLVRLHRFGHLDEDVKDSTPVAQRPSQKAMLELAAGDPRTIAQMVGVDFEKAVDEDVAEPDAWQLRLVRAPRTAKVLDHVRNWDLIRAHDPAFGVLYYNDLTLSPEASSDLPWRVVTLDTRTITMSDRWEFAHHIERAYDFRAGRDYVSGVIDAQALRRRRNPIREYLDELVWDGKPRLERCLPGVRPTPYTCFVARKVMVAAVKRMFEPGCKWDHTLVLVGQEGLGKTYWIERMALGWASSLGRIDNKDTLLTMQRSWVSIADESHSLRKSDQEAQKEFLTRTHDVYRMPYDRETLVHPRHCVIWSTTNDETFLRRQEGNRRFLTVHCTGRVNFDHMTREYIDQVWAEAVYRYRAGETIYLDELESTTAAGERERFVEEDNLTGMVLEYLDQLYPSDWEDRPLESRQRWLMDRSSEFEPPGTMRLDRVCSMQIWVEALGRRKGEARRAELLEITNILKRLPGWTAAPSRVRLPGYGPQLVFVRGEDLL